MFKGRFVCSVKYQLDTVSCRALGGLGRMVHSLTHTQLTHIQHSETTEISCSDLVVCLYWGQMKDMVGNSEPQCSPVVDRQWLPLLYMLLFKLSWYLPMLLSDSLRHTHTRTAHMTVFSLYVTYAYSTQLVCKHDTCLMPPKQLPSKVYICVYSCKRPCWHNTSHEIIIFSFLHFLEGKDIFSAPVSVKETWRIQDPKCLLLLKMSSVLRSELVEQTAVEVCIFQYLTIQFNFNFWSHDTIHNRFLFKTISYSKLIPGV